MSPAIWGRWLVFERALLAVGFGCFVALLVRVGSVHVVTWEVLGGCLLYAGCVRWAIWQRHSVLWQRVRLVAAYLFTLWFFGSIARISPALYTSFYDSHLLAIDRLLWGETPAVVWSGAGWWTQVMSAAYLSYLVYLHAALGFWLFQPLAQARRFWTYLFVTYAVGFVGYLLVPAMGPGAAFPYLFSLPLPGKDGWISTLNTYVVSNGSPVYDAFPSLHMLITCVILDFERRNARRRFWVMLPVALLLFASTIYLRYHYAIDLIAGLVCFVGLFLWFYWWERDSNRA